MEIKFGTIYSKVFTKNTLFFFCIITLLLSSCKKEADKFINVTGTVINEQTKIPISGLSVSLSQASGSGGSGSWNIIATTATDNNGNYSFYVKTKETSDWEVDINSNPYNAKYFTNRFSVNTDKKYISTIYISRRATLTINAITGNPLGPNDSFYINTPGTGCKCNFLSTNGAKGGAYNLITWTVIRNNVTTNFNDNVYCSADTSKFYTINY